MRYIDLVVNLKAPPSEFPKIFHSFPEVWFVGGDNEIPRKSETKGLLLLDETPGNVKSMELTSKDCVWRVNGGNGEWRDAKHPAMCFEDSVF